MDTQQQMIIFDREQNKQQNHKKLDEPEDMWNSQIGGKAQFNKLSPIIYTDIKEIIQDFPMEEEKSLYNECNDQNNNTKRFQSEAVILQKNDKLTTSNFKQQSRISQILGQSIPNKTYQQKQFFSQFKMGTRRFLYKFMEYCKSKMKQKQLILEKNQFSIIYDLAQGENVKYKTRVSTILRSRISNFFDQSSKSFFEWISNLWVNIKTIHPTSTMKIIWDCFHIFGILFVCFYTPLESLNDLFFDQRSELYNDYWIAFKALTLFFFIFDIFLKFNTGVYQKGELVMSKSAIAKNYISGTFTIDILSFIPIIMSVTHQKGFYQFINLLILLKIYTARRILTSFQDMFNHQQKFKSFLSIVKLWLMIIMIGHTFACLFQLLAVREEMEGIFSWMSQKNLMHSHFLVKYIYSLHFSVTTMLTVGYGDIYPMNGYECLFIIFQMLISCGVFAYSFNQIGEIIKDYNKVNDEFKSQMILVNQLLLKKQLSPDLQLKVRKYLEYKFFNEPQLSLEQENQVMTKLTDKLKQDIMNEYYINILKKFPFFNSLNSDSLRKICLHVQEHKIQLNDYLFYEGDDQNPNLCFIESGTIDICYESTKQKSEQILLNTLQRGQYFGEYSFFTGQPRTASAKTSEGAVIYCLDRQTLINCIKDQQDDYEKFCKIKDQYLQNIKTIEMQCYACHEFGHYARNCPKLHYIPDKEFIILRNQFSSIQVNRRQPKNKRRVLSKNKQLFKNALQDNKLVQTQITQFLIKLTNIEQQQNYQQQENQLEQIKSSSNEDSQSESDRQSFQQENSKQDIVQPTTQQNLLKKKLSQDYQQLEVIQEKNIEKPNFYEKESPIPQFRKNKTQPLQISKRKMSIENQLENQLPQRQQQRQLSQYEYLLQQQNIQQQGSKQSNQTAVQRRRSSVFSIVGGRESLTLNQITKKLEIDLILKDLELDRYSDYYETYKEYKHYFPQGNLQKVLIQASFKKSLENSQFGQYSLKCKKRNRLKNLQ